MEWSGLGSSSSSTTALHCTAQQSSRRSIKATKLARVKRIQQRKQVSKRARVHVCVQRSSTFLVCTEYLHEMKRKNERKKEEQASKKERMPILIRMPPKEEKRKRKSKS